MGKSFASVVTALCCCCNAAAALPPASKPFSYSSTWDPLCGINVIYAGARLLGRDVRYQELLRSEFVGSPMGSSVASLQRAAEHCGLNAVPLVRLRASDLRRSPHPVILHVQSEPGSSRYNHFVLYAGIREEHAVILNPPLQPQLVPFETLAPIWNGTGLAISNSKIGTKKLAAAAWLEYGILICATGVVLLLAVGVASHLRLTAPIMECVILLVLGTGVAYAYHMRVEHGLLRNPSAIRAVEEWHTSAFLQTVDKQQLKRMISDPSKVPVLIDARDASEFVRGHLPQARNMPVEEAERTRGNLLPGVARDHAIVVYCANERCGYARRVAQILKAEGFGQVYWYKRGFSEWTR